MTTPRHCPSCGRTVDADVIPGRRPGRYHPAIPTFLYCPVCGWCFGSEEQATA